MPHFLRLQSCRAATKVDITSGGSTGEPLIGADRAAPGPIAVRRTGMITRRAALRAGLALPMAWASQGTRADASTRSQWIRLPDGRRLGFAEYGDPAGPLVIYFHGTPGSRIEPHLIRDEIEAAGVRLVAFDRPGLGLSDYQPGRRILDCPADVACLVEALGCGASPFGVIGMSGGAPYALACLKCFPERLAHVAVVSGHAPLNAPGVERGNQDRLIAFITRRPRLGEIGLRAAIRMLHRHPDRFVERAGREWSEADRRMILPNPEYRALFVRIVHEATRCGPQGILKAIQLMGGSWGFRVGDLRGSVSIWQGGDDPITPPSMGHYFHRQIAGSELFVDPAAGHLTMPKWHAEVILARFV
jgi:pimeloyl-ACP methyl ester carboxylesterase